MPKGGRKKGGRSGPLKPEAPIPAEEPSTPPLEDEEMEQEEEGLGLGIGGAAKRKRKEKKMMAKQAKVNLSEQVVSREPSEAPEEMQQQEPEQPEPPQKQRLELVSQEFEGLGLEGARKKKPRKKKGDAGTAEPASDVFLPGPSSAPVTPMAQAPSFPSTSSRGAPAFGPGPSHSQSQVSSPTSPPPGMASRSAPLVESDPRPGAWGRGRGISPGGGRGRPAFPAAQAGPSHAQQLPRQQQHALPKAEPVPTPQTSQSPKYSQEIVGCRYKIPNKVPGRTVNSRDMIVITNYLEMTFKSLNIYRYDVSFTPDRPKKMIPEVFKKMKEMHYPKDLIAFDQTKNCYSLRPLKNVGTERFHSMVELKDVNGRNMKFEVSLKSTGVVDLGKIKRYMSERGASVNHPTEEVQCIDVILRQGTLESYVKAGRQFFKRPGHPIDLGHGYEMWTGLFQSAIFTSKAFINIDVAHKGFPKQQPLIDALQRDFNLDPHRPLERQNYHNVDMFMQFIKGVRMIATLVGECASAGQKRDYMCNGIVDPPATLKFMMNIADGKQREITVGEYFAKEKRYNIRYPHLNCMWVGPKEKSIYFPMELLHVAYGQPLARQLNDTQISKMVKEAATPPNMRLKKITEVISSMKYSTNKDFKQFGLEISDRFYQVNARVLEPPSLDIGDGRTVPRNGQWQANHLLKPESLHAWGFIAVESAPENDYENVIRVLVSAGKKMGMSIANPMLKRFDVTLTSLHNVLRQSLDNGIKFLFVVVSHRGRDHYHKVKQMAEREVGILTQCVKEYTIRRINAMTARNILLKVNSKLMGINQALGERTLPRCLQGGGVMIVGADVTHPSPEQSNVPSIAAVTASIDPKCYMYNIELSVQTPKKEMIVEFEDMIFDHLRVYKERNNNQLPKKIFVFRDGVSEGQFVQVMNSELAAVHAAYRRMAGATKKPEILFLLVQKRHHTRFFNRGDNSQYNVEPGTVVDTDIVHQSELDFYLVSHQALKGTARPTRYHAVCNDGRIPDDEVEQLTYYLCHLYSRCMRSVSYPTPTYYAHLACLRARSLTYGQKFNNRELEQRPERLHVLDKMLQYSRMFFV